MKISKFNAVMFAIFSLFLSKGASGQEIISAYSEVNLDECLLLDSSDMRARWACPGYKGYPLYIVESDLRFYVSYGFGAPDEKAAGQTLPPFNYINNKIEWRLKQTNEGNYLPFATILRWFIDTDVENKYDSMLIITKIEENNTCHIAYIDVKLVKNANQIARDIADEAAQDFDCENDEIIFVPS